MLLHHAFPAHPWDWYHSSLQKSKAGGYRRPGPHSLSVAAPRCRPGSSSRCRPSLSSIYPKENLFHQPLQRRLWPHHYSSWAFEYILQSLFRTERKAQILRDFTIPEDHSTPSSSTSTCWLLSASPCTGINSSSPMVCREDRCYGLNVCVPKNSYVEAQTKAKISEVLGGLWEHRCGWMWMESWGWAYMMWSVPLKVEEGSPSWAQVRWGHGEKAAIYKPDGNPYQELNLLAPWS